VLIVSITVVGVLRLFDTATGSVRPLALRDPGKASLYVCGPTVYDLPHLGHGRYALVFDVLRRYLLFRGLEVRFASNITDIDDKIIAKAAAEGRSESEVAKEFEDRWWEAMDALSILRPSDNPHATHYVGEMADLVAELVERGAAYETSDGVYLRVESVPGYGLLARQDLSSLRSGARVEGTDEKESPLDFALWKKAKPGEPSWPSAFGPGRPGWHTECVVMSLDLLGEGFDLHGGGQDLAFPHHENERAQAVADGKVFANHWVHNGWVVVEGEKMSKSLNNFTSLTDLLSKSDARAYRLLVLRAHYRSPLEITAATIADAEKALDRLDGVVRRFGIESPLREGPVVRGQGVAIGIDEEAEKKFVASMDDDLDSPAALAMIFELGRQAHQAADGGQEDHARALARTVSVLSGALGLELGVAKEEVDEKTQELITARDNARASKDFAKADAIRDELMAAGWVVEDGPTGTQVRK